MASGSKAWSDLLARRRTRCGRRGQARRLDRHLAGRRPARTRRPTPPTPTSTSGRPSPGPRSAAPLIGIARMLATRKAAAYYAKSTGHLPPELQKDDQDADKADAPTS